MNEGDYALALKLKARMKKLDSDWKKVGGVLRPIRAIEIRTENPCVSAHIAHVARVCMRPNPQQRVIGYLAGFVDDEGCIHTGWSLLRIADYHRWVADYGKVVAMERAFGPVTADPTSATIPGAKCLRNDSVVVDHKIESITWVFPVTIRDQAEAFLEDMELYRTNKLKSNQRRTAQC